MGVPINYLAVLLAAVASMGMGFLWYSPMLFGNQFMKLMAYSPKTSKRMTANMGKTYGITFLAALVTAYVLAHALVFGNAYLGTSGISGGLQGAFYYWLGFAMTVQLQEVLFGAKPLKLFLINTGHQLFSLFAMGAVLGFFG